MKLYPMARIKAFTRKMICNAWKATGLLPYNPTAVLKTTKCGALRKPTINYRYRPLNAKDT